MCDDYFLPSSCCRDEIDNDLMREGYRKQSTAIDGREKHLEVVSWNSLIDDLFFKALSFLEKYLT